MRVSIRLQAMESGHNLRRLREPIFNGSLPVSSQDGLNTHHRPSDFQAAILGRNSVIGVPAIGGNPQKTWTPSPVYSQDELNTHHRPSDFQKAILGMTPFSPAYSSSA